MTIHSSSPLIADDLRGSQLDFAVVCSMINGEVMDLTLTQAFLVVESERAKTESGPERRI